MQLQGETNNVSSSYYTCRALTDQNHKILVCNLQAGTCITMEGDGLAVKSVISNDLRCRSPRFESRNEKDLGLNPTILTLDPLVSSWDWDNSYNSPISSGPSG